MFLGPASPEAAGDYASGPITCLPTSGAARLRGGLSSADFVKVISVQELKLDALARLTPAITTLARAEGLEAPRTFRGGSHAMPERDAPTARSRAPHGARILRPLAGAKASCVSISTRTPSAALPASSRR